MHILEKFQTYSRKISETYSEARHMYLAPLYKKLERKKIHRKSLELYNSVIIQTFETTDPMSAGQNFKQQLDHDARHIDTVILKYSFNNYLTLVNSQITRLLLGFIFYFNFFNFLRSPHLFNSSKMFY